MALPAQGRLSWGRGARAGLLPALALACGCVTTLGLGGSENGPPKPGVPCQVTAVWQNHVAYAPDPVQGGAPTPGLAGRVYLFGREMGHPMAGDGQLSMSLYDETSGTPVQQEVWNFDPVSLQKLLKRDFMGWGYTVFLPWSRYSPDVTKVRMRVCFQPTKGSPLYSEGVVTLAGENGVITQSVPTAPMSFSKGPASPPGPPPLGAGPQAGPQLGPAQQAPPYGPATQPGKPGWQPPVGGPQLQPPGGPQLPPPGRPPG